MSEHPRSPGDPSGNGRPARHPDSRYVVVTGSIAAGATTLSEELIKQFGWRGLLEGQVNVDNPFFADSYDDPMRWRFHSQVHFLTASVDRHDRLADTLVAPGTIVEDRTPFEHNGAYTAVHEKLSNITEAEAKALHALGAVVERHYLVPDLLIYREMTEARVLEAVAQRDRPGESSIDADTLIAIWREFDHFADGWDRSPIIRVPAGADVLDPVQFKLIAQQVANVLEHPRI